MAKTVFHPGELKKSEDTVVLTLPFKFIDETEEAEVEEVEEYTGPSPDDIRREVEQLRSDWETEKAQLLAEAREEAGRIVKEAEQAAFEEVRRKTDQAQIIRQEAENDAAEIRKNAQSDADKLTENARQEKSGELENARRDGRKLGQEEGYQEGYKEAERLVGRLHTIIEKTMEKRQEILEETEQQIIDLVLLITRKVVKVISDTQKTIVVSNIVQALRKVKGRGDVSIRVNMEDLELTTDHTKEFLAAVENVQNITVMEDSSVDRGGCIIETDFGDIDARISSQLSELEQKILEISPIRTRSRNSLSQEAPESI